MDYKNMSDDQVDELDVIQLREMAQQLELDVSEISAEALPDFCAIYHDKIRPVLVGLKKILGHWAVRWIITRKPSKIVKQVIELLDRACPAD